MRGYYDIHCHILPGVDDGAGNMEMVKQMLCREYDDGVRTIYATPHYRLGMFETPKEKILQQYKLVKEQAKQIGDGIEIYLGCEFHASVDMINMLHSGMGTFMGDSRCILTEFSQNNDFRFVRECCHTLLRHGYQPIIAHAERYPALNKSLEKFNSLADMGVYIQVDADSILGKNGFYLKRFCRKLIEWDLLHFIGSDAHNMSSRKPAMGQCAEYVKRRMGQLYMNKIFIDNPCKLIEEGR